MNISITDKAKQQLTLMQEHNVPIMLAKFPAGGSGFTYRIVSAGQSKNDKVYNIDGIDIIVSEDLEKTLKGAKINYGGWLFKDFMITPQYGNSWGHMYKLWAKKISKNRIVNSIVVKNKEDISISEKRDKCLKELCQKLDISMPVWLKNHELEFSQFKYVTFYPQDFIDEIDFDKLEVELIDDGKEAGW